MIRLFINPKRRNNSASRRMLRLWCGDKILADGWADCGIKRCAWISEQEFNESWPDGIKLVYLDEPGFEDNFWGIACDDEDKESLAFINSLKIESKTYY